MIKKAVRCRFCGQVGGQIAGGLVVDSTSGSGVFALDRGVTYHHVACRRAAEREIEEYREKCRREEQS